MPLEADVKQHMSQRGYEFVKKIAEGGTSTIYLTSFRPPQRCVKRRKRGEEDDNLESDKVLWMACKVIDMSRNTKVFVDKFLFREIDILSKVHHPHIIHVFGIHRFRSALFVFTRLAECGDLLEFVQRNGPVSEGTARLWSRQIALALHYLNCLDIVHRDVRCENIFISAKKNAKLGDFGFSRYLLEDRDGVQRLSETYCGTISYSAPEVLAGQPYDPRLSDIWSLGVTIFAMLHGKMPFPEPRNVKEFFEFQVHKGWRMHLDEGLSTELGEVLSHLLEVDVGKRWTLDEFLNSPWMAREPGLLQLTPDEKGALSVALDSRKRRDETAPRREAVAEEEESDDTESRGWVPEGSRTSAGRSLSEGDVRA
uniref:Protein kinase domain-containing protein n=1 Tax=Timema tahoe TaxID=61484 RepID=A0A7R9IBW2_9NEOP|nr:unnamed protein product [Timema tahoe]